MALQELVQPSCNGRAKHPGTTTNHLAAVIRHAAHLLPAQGPITVFIHHNTLHAFEQKPFLEGVRSAARVYGCEPFLPEWRYREALRRGRIRLDELEEVLWVRLGAKAYAEVPLRGTRLDLRLAMLQHPIRTGTPAEVDWMMAETDALRRFAPGTSAVTRTLMIAETRRWVMRERRDDNGRRLAGPAALLGQFSGAEVESWGDDDWEAFTLQALWQICREGVAKMPRTGSEGRRPIRHRDVLLEATGSDCDLRVHDLLIRYTASFLDQGLAHWRLPNREDGYFRAFCRLYRLPAGPPAEWLRGLPQELAGFDDEGTEPIDVIRETMNVLGVAPHEEKEYIEATLLALRGWAGMIEQVARRADRVAHPIPEDSLTEFLAVRLLLDKYSATDLARRELGFAGSPAGIRSAFTARGVNTEKSEALPLAFLVFQLAQLRGWTPNELRGLSREQWAELVGEVEQFCEAERREVFHLAYEARFRTQTLDALAVHSRRPRLPSIRPPRFQVIVCLDEREESFRRHIEEVAPDAETFGTAGFFAAAMYYRGAADAHFVPLCPIVMRPGHWVAEQVDESADAIHRRRAKARRALGGAAHGFRVGSRSLALGAVLSASVGVLASVPLIARILFPRLTARSRRFFGRAVQPPPATRLRLERTDPTPGPENGQLGYSVTEMTGIAERLLRDIGLTGGFARWVIVLGHGSSSLNNPHKSAYDCGACGGSPGAPNARAVAEILNDPRVRGLLAERGVSIPADTQFVGGFHNTSNDSVTLFDPERIPDTHRAEFEAVRADIDAACDRNAHERCRRFQSAPLTLTFPGARSHVEARSEDLAQTRPELGHATNAICVVGRRRLTRGLFLDRRAFLASYDPTQDDGNAAVLTRTLQAIFPVCGGINLEYFFSHVDPLGYGCGTKLPHNVTSLLGVMDGPASDLRTGLPWQMVEFHEPVRLLIVCETSAETMTRILNANPQMGNLARNAWVRLAVIDPDTASIREFTNGTFADYEPRTETLPTAPTSADWYRGWRDHLEFAEIDAR